MRRSWLLWLTPFVATLAMIAPAAAQFHQGHHHAAVAAPMHHHFSLHQAAATNVGTAATVGQSTTTYYQHHHHGNGGSFNGGGSFNNGVGFAPISVFSYWTGGYPLMWGNYYTPAFGVAGYGPYYYPPPSTSFVPRGDPVAPAERLARMQQRNAAPAPEPAKPEPKTTTAEQRAKAGRFIGVGDTNFGKQKFMAALDRYRSAASTAPDVPEAFLRQGFALVALGQYPSAAKAFRRGLALRGDWSGSPLRIDQLYDDARLVKNGHLENLAKAVEANPWDANLLVALAVEMYFDGQHDRAGVFFARADQLGGNTDRALDGFLPQPGPKGEQKLGVPKVAF